MRPSIKATIQTAPDGRRILRMEIIPPEPLKKATIERQWSHKGAAQNWACTYQRNHRFGVLSVVPSDGSKIPFHRVVRSLFEAQQIAPATIQELEAGRVPKEGMFQMQTPDPSSILQAA